MSHDKSAKSHRSGGNPILFIIIAIIAIVAVRRELRLPKEERTWHGTVDVPVPYDFRPPTAERFKAAFWAPEDERYFPPKAIGIGWSVNVARVLRRSS